ncbi:biotin/lipoyl-containing protein, partial [Nocardioides sp.]|uniref:ATP-binding protein n=1 Tax=Nocardioides sp. TaxID=35761 RepID=UPI002736227E
VEEAPAPGLPEEVRTALHDAARAAAKEIDSRGAGTVEFLHDPVAERFFFLEMNTRLQVEHPVTEEVTGLDLVELQIAAAEGVAHPDLTAEPQGHAIEVRLYAEDPGSDWQPQSGLLTAFEVPGVTAEFTRSRGEGIRLDTGFESGNEVSTHYDAMLAKVISWAPTREQAARQLAGALARARIHGLVTNRDLLVRILRSSEFLDAELGTDFLDRTDLLVTATSDLQGPATAAALALAERGRAARTVQRGIPVGWRNVVSQPQVTTFSVDSREDQQEVRWLGGRDGYRVDGVEVIAASGDSVTLEIDGVRTTYAVAITDATVDVDSPSAHVRLTQVPRFTDPADQVASGSLLAPMPGTVVSVVAEQGQQVEAGATVLVLEAMKMQHTVSAPHAGTVTDLPVTAGQQVAAGDVLAVVATDPETEESNDE